MSGIEFVYGRHAVQALVARDMLGVLEFWLQEGQDDALAQSLTAMAAQAGVHVQRVSRRTLDRKLGGARHQGVAVRYRASTGGSSRQGVAFEDLLEGVGTRSLILALDGVEDPHNVGACLRSAAAAGARAVIAPRSRGAPLTAAVRKVAAGGADAVPFVQVPNLARALAQLGDAGYRRAGAAGEAGLDVWEADLGGSVVLVVGGEQNGLRRLTRIECDQLLRIPMAAGARGHTDCQWQGHAQARGYAENLTVPASPADANGLNQETGVPDSFPAENVGVPSSPDAEHVGVPNSPSENSGAAGSSTENLGVPERPPEHSSVPHSPVHAKGLSQDMGVPASNRLENVGVPGSSNENLGVPRWRVESLNVSVAAGICLFEWVRQNRNS